MTHRNLRQSAFYTGTGTPPWTCSRIYSRRQLQVSYTSSLTFTAA